MMDKIELADNILIRIACMSADKVTPHDCDCRELAQLVKDEPLISQRESYQRGHAAGEKKGMEEIQQVLHDAWRDIKGLGRIAITKRSFCEELSNKIRARIKK